MSKNMSEKLKSIELALANEMHERSFYLLHSRTTMHPIGRKMFESIAEDEQEHYERLQRIHEELAARGTWPEHVAAVVNGIDLRQFLADIVRSSGDAASATADDRDALKTAIDFETKGYAFYLGLSNKATWPAEQTFFSRIAEMEREHFLSLRQTLLYFEDPAVWYAELEKPALEG